MCFESINTYMYHLIQIDKQCFFGQVGSQGQYTWRQELGSPRKIAHGRSRPTQHQGTRRCGRTCADGDNLDEALAS